MEQLTSLGPKTSGCAVDLVARAKELCSEVERVGIRCLRLPLERLGSDSATALFAAWLAKMSAEYLYVTHTRA